MTCGFTGHCAYSYDCDRGRLVAANVLAKLHQRDGTRWGVEAENWAYSNSNLAVASSKWMAEQAKQSMFNCFPIHHIGLDTKTYQLSILNSAVHYWRYQQVKKF